MPEQVRTILTKESEGMEVVYLQSLLKILDYRKTSPNGIFNLDTEHQVKSFQADSDLLIDGEVDEETWDALEDEIRRLQKVAVRIPYLDIEIPWWGCVIIGSVLGGLVVGLIATRRK